MASTALPAIRPRFVTLPGTDVHYPLAYMLTKRKLAGEPSNHDSDLFVVFVNGLGLPQAFWQPAIEILTHDLEASATGDHSSSTVTILTYDRKGQGLSQPPDAEPPEPHDLLYSVTELHGMVEKFHPSSHARLFLVAHSIGVPLVRLYCQHHPGKASAILMLDSNIATTDFVSLFPDPDQPTFDPVRDLPADTSVEQLRWTIENYRKLFHPSVPNPERLIRSNLASLLPEANQPIIQGPDGKDMVLLTVVSHDPEAFAEEGLRISTKGLTMRYVEPVWHQYNLDLLDVGRSSLDGDSKGHVVVAKGAGHFIQRDNPQCVAQEVSKTIRQLLRQ